MLPTVQALSEMQNRERTGGEKDQETPRNKDGEAQEDDQGIRGVECVVQLTESASAAH